MEQGTQYEHYWKQLKSSHHLHPGNRFRYDLIIESIRKIQEERKYTTLNIIDVGCGDGELLRLIKTIVPNANLLGIDIAKTEIEFKFFQADIGQPLTESLRELSSSFDVVVCSEVIEHVDDDQLVMKNLFSLLNDTGVLILTTQSGPRFRMEKDVLGHLRHYTKHRLSDLVSSQNGQLISMQNRGFPWLLLQKIGVHLAFSLVKKVLIENKTMSAKMRRVLDALYLLYKRDIPGLGPQLILVAKRK